MDSWKIEFARSAEKDLRKLDRQVIPRVLSVIESLATDPHPIQTKKLVGSGHTYRIRIGDYRVVYSLEGAVRIILVERVRHRKDVYS